MSSGAQTWSGYLRITVGWSNKTTFLFVCPHVSFSIKHVYMGRYLRGYFNSLNCEEFQVDIYNDAEAEVEEITLAGKNPFVVTYETSNTPFEPIRFSRASINVVADEKFFDVFSNEAQGTKVILTNNSTSKVEWVGYLTTNLLQMPNFCGLDTFTLEAQDCLSTLENYDYELIGEHKAVVTFREIMSEIAIKCGFIENLYVDASITDSANTGVNLNRLTISEQNFFSSDTDEPWNLREVLEELCRYLGYTAMQYRTNLHLYDIQFHSSFTWQSDESVVMSLRCYRYRNTDGFVGQTLTNYAGLASGCTLRQSIIRGSSSDISLEPIYNKVQVKDSFYEIDHFIPDIFEDSLLTNKLGDFWKCNQLGASNTFTYLNKKGKPKKEEKSEAEHVYYIRRFDHDFYTTTYRDKTSLQPVSSPTVEYGHNIHFSEATENGAEYPQAHYGWRTMSAKFTNNDNAAHTLHISAFLSYDAYQTYYQTHNVVSGSSASTITLQPGASQTVALTLVVDWGASYIMYSKDYDMTYTIDSDTIEWSVFKQSSDVPDSTDVISAVITDLATFDKPMSTTKYNYETEANINFTRYLCIHQCDKPNRMHPYCTYQTGTALTPLHDNEINAYFPTIFALNSGYTNPMIFNDNAYLYLDASAIFERYNVEWINPDWTHDNTSMNGLGLFNKTAAITTMSPALIFKLKIGNEYWSTESGWTTTDSCFVVNLSTDKTDSDDCDFTAWWNEDHTALNNVNWTDWAGAKGYKIPLKAGMNMNSAITFEVHMPSEIQKVNTSYSHDGMNNYCWIKNLKLEFTTKDKENYDNADVLYENIIDSGSVNTLSDITCKFTTYPGNGMHSYSSVALDGKLLDRLKKTGLDGVANKPEENVVKAYSNQYSFPTIKQNMTLTADISPLSRLKDPTLDKYFGILGQTIDYAEGSAQITMIETRTWSL